MMPYKIFHINIKFLPSQPLIKQTKFYSFENTGGSPRVACEVAAFIKSSLCNIPIKRNINNFLPFLTIKYTIDKTTLQCLSCWKFSCCYQHQLPFQYQLLLFETMHLRNNNVYQQHKSYLLLNLCRRYILKFYIFVQHLHVLIIFGKYLDYLHFASQVYLTVPYIQMVLVLTRIKFHI
ncbi:hypothetical protein V1477_008982 [Vespula maculifrons]|uniref:Transmembrane protein n=1 Tax=Vespula maculifrons TaxID=7453 RepID=A0ABD2CGX6_VESMC